MPWIDALSDPQELRRCIRDLVALSTLPAIWTNYDPHQIADSAAAALVSMLEAEFVHIRLRRRQEEPAIEVTRIVGDTDPVSAEMLGIAVRQWLARRLLDPAAFVHPGVAGTFRVAAAPIGFGSDSIIVAGARREEFPSETRRLLLGMAANDATIALQRWYAEADERRFAELVENSSDFIAFASLDGAPEYINAAGLQLVGLSGLEAASDLHVLDFFMPDERVRAHREIWPQVMRDGRWVGETRLRHFVSGDAIPFLVEWFRIDDPRTGQPMNIATVSRDLRAQKRSERELRHLNETLEQRVGERTAELAQANERLVAEMMVRERTDARLHELRLELLHSARLSVTGQLTAALAHELNQPLAATTNTINAARRVLANGKAARCEELRELLDEAVGQVLRAGQIIRRLREFVTRGETEKRVESVPTMIEEAGALALIGSGAMGVRVDFRFDPKVTNVFADRIQIQQVLANLMRNALEAMVGRQRRKLAVSAVLVDTATVEIAVADTGPGIPPEIQGRLFEPFVSTKPNGMGLGLSICRTIVEAHGGLLRSDANAGGGTIFRFTLAAAAGHGGDDAK